MWLELVGTGYLFSDASLTKPLTPGEEIMVDADGYSPWRRLATSGTSWWMSRPSAECWRSPIRRAGLRQPHGRPEGIPLEEGSFIGFIGSRAGLQSDSSRPRSMTQASVEITRKELGRVAPVMLHARDAGVPPFPAGACR